MPGHATAIRSTPVPRGVIHAVVCACGWTRTGLDSKRAARRAADAHKEGAPCPGSR